jgi:hypothetical protein
MGVGPATCRVAGEAPIGVSDSSNDERREGLGVRYDFFLKRMHREPLQEGSAECGVTPGQLPVC